MDFTIDPVWLVAAGAVVNLVVAFATKQKGGSGVKALLAIVLCVVATVAKDVVQVGGGNFTELAAQAVTLFVAQLTTYLGFMAPVIDINSRTLPNMGIGKLPFAGESEAA